MSSLRTFGVLISVFLLQFFLSGCGDKPVFIADKVRFRVNFAQKVVQISYDLNPDYQVKTSKEIFFEDLGMVYLNWSDQIQKNEVGTRLNAAQDSLNAPRPVKALSKFPNGRNLPKSVPENEKLKEWKQDDQNGSMQISIIYESEPKLVIGGALLSKQFNSAPKNFLATQEFKAANGDVEATISFVGPTKNSLGGIYYFGNFGSYPFEDFMIAALRQDETELEWSFDKSEPVQIVDQGSGWWFWKFFSVNSSMQNLIDDVETFN